MAQLLKVDSTSEFKKKYKKLPVSLQNKFTKQLKLLVEDYRHPSLRTRKMVGVDKFEVRIDLHYRFTFELTPDTLTLRTIGPHDEGLGKK